MTAADDHRASLDIVSDAYRQLLGYLDNRPLKCFDRADFKGLPLVVKLQQARMRGNIAATLLLKALYLKAWIAPYLVRRLLGVRPGLTASGLAFYASALTDCFKLDRDDQLLIRTKEVLDVLKGLNVSADNEPAWGFPFDWVSYELIPANTPIGYTTYTAGDAFIAHYLASGDKDSLNWAKGACDYIANRLDRTPVGDGLAIAYTPLDNSQVSNYNALSAALMLEIDKHCDESRFEDLAHSMLRFVLQRQQADGSWFYAEDGSRIDHYHTAMTLQGLTRCVPFLAQHDLRRQLVNAIHRGLDYHLHNMWVDDAPINSNLSRYPLDPMSPAETAIAFGCITSQDLLEDSGLANTMKRRWIDTMLWTINMMQNRDGSFATLYSPIRSLQLRSLRWGDAPLLRALAVTLAWLRGCGGFAG